MRLNNYKMVLVGCVLTILLICVLFAPVLAPYDPYEVNVSIKMAPPSLDHLLGTDNLGRDVLSRLIYGAQYSITLALTISLLDILLGGTVGLIVGWHGGKLEKCFYWIASIFSTFPSFLLAIATAGVLGQGHVNLIISIVLVEWIYYARLVSNFVQTQKFSYHVIAAKLLGYKNGYVIMKHILPFIYRPVLTLALMNIGSMVLMISSFSFLGIGVQPSLAEWGMMLHDAKNFFRTNVGLMLYPSIAIFLTVMAFNTLGRYLQGEER